jgi:hypothetical protein
MSDEMDPDLLPPHGAQPTHHPDMLQTDRRFDSEAMRTVLDKGYAYWAALAEHPAIAAALARFPSERQTRKTGRLDLVAWVHVISAFGVDGPADAHWDQLFTACCFEAPHQPDDPIPYLRESCIAVLLAFAKVTEDVPESTSHANVIKQRIRPAVIGRVEARAPGIIHQVQRKYDNFVYSYINKGFVMDCIKNCHPERLLANVPDLLRATARRSASVDPQAYTRPETYHDNNYYASLNGSASPTSPPRPELPSRSWLVLPGHSRKTTGDTIRELAHSHAAAEVKEWESIMSSFLNLDPTGSLDSPRIATYLRERESVRAQFQDGLCTRFSFYLCEQLEARPYDSSCRFHRHSSFDSLSSLSSAFALTNSNVADFLNDENLGFDVYGDEVLGTQADMRAQTQAQISASNTVFARVTVLELHAPGAFGTASLEFFPVVVPGGEGAESTPTSPTDVRNVCSDGIDPKGHACFRLADRTSSSSVIQVPGVSRSTECRALQLVVEVIVLPLETDSRIRNFRYNSIKKYEWIALGSHGTTDSCLEMDAKDGMSDSSGDPAFASEHVQQSSLPGMDRIACSKASRAGLNFFTTEAACHSMKQFPVSIWVPRSVLALVDRTTDMVDWDCRRSAALFGLSSSMDFDPNTSDVDVFHRTIGIDFRGVARFAYHVGGGVEIAAGHTAEPGLFERCTSWKWRRV